MTTVPVVWWTANPDSIARGYWDQAVLEALMDRTLWHPPNALTFEHHEAYDEWVGHPMTACSCGKPWPCLELQQGAVVVVPGGHNVQGRYVEALQRFLTRLPWALVIVTGDEERTFPIDQLPGHVVVWATGARPGPAGARIAEVLGFGVNPAVLTALRATEPTLDPMVDVAFYGQVTHERRESMMDAIAALDDRVSVSTYATAEFGGTAGPAGDGVTPSLYATLLATAKLAPAPSGPVIPDSFRLFEALEAGALPIADTVTVAHGAEPSYWTEVCGQSPPFPEVTDWQTQLPRIVTDALAGWPANANRAGSWWSARKRTLAMRLDSTIRQLAGLPLGVPEPDDEITVIITTSPTPAHPSTDAIGHTIASVRARLPRAEIIVMCDGVRPELEHRRVAYEQYQRYLLQRATREWSNVLVLRREEWGHQANSVRDALEHVVTPFVLPVEHDAPFVGPSPDWAVCLDMLHSGAAHVIRFHHESRVLPDHEHLMLDVETDPHSDFHALRTVQWSQRPHLAPTLMYREWLDRYFGSQSRTMIEDVMHGVVDYHWRTYGEAGWEQFRLWLYADPDDGGSIQRTEHLDSRADDPKFEMLYAYDGPRPVGSPAPTRRVP